MFWVLVVAGSLCATTDRLHDLHAVSGLQMMTGVRDARDDLTIDLHGDPSIGQREQHQQPGDVGVVWDVARLAVELDLHRFSLAVGRPSRWARILPESPGGLAKTGAGNS